MLRQLPVMSLAALLVTACATTLQPLGRVCESPGFVVDARFEGGAFERCEFTSEDAVEITILPEDPPPINPSPWYAFHVGPKRPGSLTVELAFPDGYARYWPKTSTGEGRWTPVEEGRVSISEDGKRMEVELPFGEGAFWLAGQEVVTAAYYDRWLAELATRGGVGTRSLGHSVEGRPIHLVESGDGPEVVLLLGRQHPPEVTGALAMRPFVDTVLGDSLLARRFRGQYRVLVLPLLNPDGVAQGHWRHNADGVDLNRDWGQFTQPETRSVQRLLAELEESGFTPRLMLDFHSTRRTLAYTQRPEDDTEPRRFAGRWLAAVRERLPGFEISHEARAPSGQANTKNFFFGRYGIPSITVELGDRESRELIARAAPVLAEEMMRLLLERPR